MALLDIRSNLQAFITLVPLWRPTCQELQQPDLLPLTQGWTNCDGHGVGRVRMAYIELCLTDHDCHGAGWVMIMMTEVDAGWTYHDGHGVGGQVQAPVAGCACHHPLIPRD